MTVDDTTPAPGQTVNFSFTYTLRAGDTNGESLGFGEDIPNGSTATENLADLSFGSCGGDLFKCNYDPAQDFAFFGGISGGTPGTAVAGTADFTVSSSATDGEHISAFGLEESQSSTISTPRLTLIVTTPKSDLGVGLSATAQLLNPKVNYDAAITNNGPAAATSATVTTQLPSQATGITSSTCTYNSSTDQVSCPIGALANGATTHATFTTTYGLLTIGLPLSATATRTASSPTDPNATNDSATANCTAITALLITC
jgi:uncharacterized repeat protein (TIGR01451 family)